MSRALAPILFSALATCALAATAADVRREQHGTRTSEDIPEIPPALAERLQRYSNTRAAVLGGWSADGTSILVGTRFANTVQVHRVAMPGGAREQLTFHDEPIATIAPNPKRDGFVFGKDTGGSEFWQLYWFDGASRETRLLTDGKSRNESPLWSHDGRRLAYTSTARNGSDSDVWVLDFDSGAARPVVTAGGRWAATDFSPDGKSLLVQQFVSINEVYPGVVDLENGQLTRFPVDGGKAAFGAFLWSHDGRGVYYTSDEGSEFLTLRHHDVASGRLTQLTAKTPWNVEKFALSHDGERIAYVTNEDGYGVLHVIDAASGAEVALPPLPRGVIGSIDFDPADARIAFDLNSATSPSDVWSVDLRDGALARWTTSEIGGLDASKFVAPELVRYPTFDRAGGKPRTIPAFYYRPRAAAAGAKVPAVVIIHGGPESQARPVFSADIQFLADELGIAVLVPNVRGSDGYGKGYLKLDNGYRREDSVRDVGALLDWIATRPEIDAGRVGVLGGSYGGYMVLASLAHYPDRLRAGIDIVGISNFVTFLTNTESYRRDLRRVEYGDERDPKMKAFLARISPTTNAKSITSPLFVASGANDPRVPASEGQQIARTVRANGGDVWYLEFADEGHGFRKKANSDYYRAAAMLFWQKHLLGAGS